MIRNESYDTREMDQELKVILNTFDDSQKTFYACDFKKISYKAFNKCRFEGCRFDDVADSEFANCHFDKCQFFKNFKGRLTNCQITNYTGKLVEGDMK